MLTRSSVIWKNLLELAYDQWFVGYWVFPVHRSTFRGSKTANYQLFRFLECSGSHHYRGDKLKCRLELNFREERLLIFLKFVKKNWSYLHGCSSPLVLVTIRFLRRCIFPKFRIRPLQCQKHIQPLKHPAFLGYLFSDVGDWKPQALATPIR